MTKSVCCQIVDEVLNTLDDDDVSQLGNSAVQLQGDSIK